MRTLLNDEEPLNDFCVADIVALLVTGGASIRPFSVAGDRASGKVDIRRLRTRNKSYIHSLFSSLMEKGLTKRPVDVKSLILGVITGHPMVLVLFNLSSNALPLPIMRPILRIYNFLIMHSESLQEISEPSRSTCHRLAKLCPSACTHVFQEPPTCSQIKGQTYLS